MHLVIARRQVSPIPIGEIPGHSSMARSRPAMSARIAAHRMVATGDLLAIHVTRNTICTPNRPNQIIGAIIGETEHPVSQQ
jgi:hypothetical protein